MIKFFKKLNIIKNEHLSLNNNWNCISQKMSIFHKSSSPVNFYEWLDKELKEKNIKEKWSGFLHNVISYPTEEYPEKYRNKILPLSSLVEDPYFLNKLEDCEEIFVFTDQVKNFLIKKTSFERIKSVTHPVPDFVFQKKKWSGEFDQLLHVGQQLRKYHSFLDLKTELARVMIKPFAMDGDLIEMKKYSKNIVSIIDQVSIEEYFELLSRSIIFLDLYDVAACNTILECIVLNVPILIKKIDGVVEYLGEDYPFYFETLKEASSKLKDVNLIHEASDYLSSLNKEKYYVDEFIKEMNERCI